MKNKDKIEMEYEARVMLDKSKYDLLVKNHTSFNMISSTNENYYYDTVDLALTHHSMVLRKRIKGSEKELTLKIKGIDGDKEITIDDIDESKDLSLIISENMKKEISSIGVNKNDLHLVSILKTERKEIFFDDYTLVIDKNDYNNKTDYNLEIEAKNKSVAELILTNYIKQYSIDNSKKYISKSRRAIFKL